MSKQTQRSLQHWAFIPQMDAESTIKYKYRIYALKKSNDTHNSFFWVGVKTDPHHGFSKNKAKIKSLSKHIFPMTEWTDRRKLKWKWVEIGIYIDKIQI